jgi:hypothetical protein
MKGSMLIDFSPESAIFRLTIEHAFYNFFAFELGASSKRQCLEYARGLFPRAGGLAFGEI